MRELVKCPDCGADMQIGDVEAYVPHLSAHGLVSIAPVMLHAKPLCERWQQRHDSAFEDAERMVEDLKRANEDEDEEKNQKVK